MADQQYDYENVPVAVRRRESDGVAEFGVVINGKFFGFGGTSLGGFDADIQEAANAKAEQVRQQAVAEQQQAPSAAPQEPQQPQTGAGDTTQSEQQSTAQNQDLTPQSPQQ